MGARRASIQYSPASAAVTVSVIWAVSFLVGRSDSRYVQRSPTTNDGTGISRARNGRARAKPMSASPQPLQTSRRRIGACRWLNVSSIGLGMNILLLGGGLFLGAAIADHAAARGHRLTVFNRGRSRGDWPAGVEAVVGDRTSDLGRLDGRRFDAVVDTCGYVPADAQARAAAREAVPASPATATSA